jgi:serine/threonine-protein kinase
MNLSNSPTLSVATTQQGVILGTAAYMSPEQAKGKAVDKRADIWAFGCVLFEMLAGRNAFSGKDVSDILAAVIRAEPEWNSLPANLHWRLKELFERCLEKEAKDRLSGISDARVEIQKVLADSESLFAQRLEQPPERVQRSMRLWIAIAAIFGATIAGIAIAFVMRPSPPQLARFTMSDAPNPIVATGSTPSVAISPDGTRIVFVGPEFQLYVRSLDKLEPVALGGASGINPFISPDGNWVGFRANEANGTIKKVSILGGPPVTITSGFGGIMGASWGPDGQIIFGTTESEGLYIVSAAGDEERKQLTTLEEDETEHRWPEILPGGRAVLFTIHRGDEITKTQIAVLNLETGERTVLISGGSNPHYAPTGHIVYGIDGTLRAVRFDLDSLVVTGDPIPVLEGVVTRDQGDAHFSFSQDGTLVYIPGIGSENPTEEPLGIVGRDGRVEPLNLPPGKYSAPRVSPSGDRIAYMREGGGGGWDVWIYNLSGSNAPRQLTFGEGNSFPVWFPDGERVAFQSSRDGDLGIFWKNADGTGVAERLTTPEDGVEHVPDSFSPDGEILLFSAYREEGEAAVSSMTLADGEVSLFVGLSGARIGQSLFSHDGRWVAYQSNETGISEIFVQPFPPNGAKYMLPNTLDNHHPVWSPDDSELFYVPGPGRFEVVDVTMLPSFDFGNPELLPAGTFYLDAPRVIRNFDILPDGERFVSRINQSSAGDGAAQGIRIIVVLNWFEELKERVPLD